MSMDRKRLKASAEDASSPVARWENMSEKVFQCFPGILSWHKGKL